jgi:hypothetical protein
LSKSSIDRFIAPLVDLIHRHLTAGAQLDRKTLLFLQSTYGIGKADDLSLRLREMEGGDGETVRDLVFSPDPVLQREVESILKGRGLPGPDVDTVRDRLAARGGKASFWFPGNGERFSLPIDRAAISSLVDRLQLSVSLPDRLIEQVLARRSGTRANVAAGVLVRLRHSRLAFAGFQSRFLERFLEGFPADRKDYWDCLDLLLALLSERPDGSDPYRVLMGKKAFLFRQLSQARKARALLEKSNMETLAMTGVRVPSLDTRAAVKAMEHIDTVAIHLFGRTDPVHGDPVSVDLGEVADSSGVEEISRRLSG